jgi:hypothetical protein
MSGVLTSSVWLPTLRAHICRWPLLQVLLGWLGIGLLQDDKERGHEMRTLANKPAAGNAGIASQLTIEHHWPGVPIRSVGITTHVSLD